VKGNGRGLTGAIPRHMSGDNEEGHKILRRIVSLQVDMCALKTAIKEGHFEQVL